MFQVYYMDLLYHKKLIPKAIYFSTSSVPHDLQFYLESLQSVFISHFDQIIFILFVWLKYNVYLGLIDTVATYNIIVGSSLLLYNNSKNKISHKCSNPINPSIRPKNMWHIFNTLRYLCLEFLVSMPIK